MCADASELEIRTLWADPAVRSLTGHPEASVAPSLEDILAELDRIGKWALSAHPVPAGPHSVIEYLCTLRYGTGLLGALTSSPSLTAKLAAARCLHRAATALENASEDSVSEFEKLLSRS